MTLRERGEGNDEVTSWLQGDYWREPLVLYDAAQEAEHALERVQTMEDAPTSTECERYTNVEYEVRADGKDACASHEMRSVEARGVERGGA